MALLRLLLLLVRVLPICLRYSTEKMLNPGLKDFAIEGRPYVWAL